MKKIKSLGIAVTAMLAIAMSTGASSASATANLSMWNEGGYVTAFQTDVYPTPLAANEFLPHVLEFGNGAYKLDCNVSFSGTQTNAKSVSVDLAASYKDCAPLMSWADTTTIDMNSCHYRLMTKLEKASSPYPGVLHVVCDEAGDGIVLTGSVGGGKITCTVTIPAQSNINGIAYETVPGFWNGYDAIAVGFNSNNISYTVTSSSIVCPSKGTHSNGTYTGSMALHG